MPSWRSGRYTPRSGSTRTTPPRADHGHRVQPLPRRLFPPGGGGCGCRGYVQRRMRPLPGAARRAPGRAVPEAARAFTLLLRAAAHKDLYERLPAPERDDEGRAAARLLQQGAAAARQAFADDKDDPAALRAMAFAEAIAGTADRAVAHADQAERAAPRDAWVLYAKAAAAKANRAHEKAVQGLSEARQIEPRLLRADVDLADIALDRGAPAGARRLPR